MNALQFIYVRGEAFDRNLGYFHHLVIIFKSAAKCLHQLLAVSQHLECLDNKNFDMIKGKSICIMGCQRDSSLRKSGVGNVFIKKLYKSIDKKALYDTVSALGNILSCKIKYNENSFTGYAFVHFKTMEKINAMLLNDHNVSVGIFKSCKKWEAKLGAKAKEFTNVYIKNFGEEINDENLKELFSQFECQGGERSQ